MKIRALELADWENAYKLWQSCDGIGVKEKDDSQNGYARFLNRNPDTCFAAVDENGTLCATILAGNDGRRGYIYHLAVLPACRKNGLGTALVERSLGALRQCGIEKAALVAFAENETGNKFWESCGFKARTDLLYRDKEL